MINVSKYLKMENDLELCLLLLDSFLNAEGSTTVDFGGISGDYNVSRAANALCVLYTISTPEEMRNRIKAVHMPSSSRFAKSISKWREYAEICKHLGVFPWSIITSILATGLSHDERLVARLANLLSIHIEVGAIDSRWRKEEGGIKTTIVL